MISQNIKKSNKSLNTKKPNFFQKDGDIYDINKYGITKINSKINNNLFNIILVDKKSENKIYSKKPSFLNISTNGIFHETLGNKETKSENIDESSEKLHNRMNGLFFNKNVIRKINEDEQIKSINNNSLIIKNTNKSIAGLDVFYNNQKRIDNDKSSIIINKQIKLNNDEKNNNLSLTYIPNGNEDIKININEENQNSDN